MRAFCGYLAANLTIAANLGRIHGESRGTSTWGSLIARARKIGCRLQMCRLDASCDGSCGCGPALYDRNGFVVGDLEHEDLATFTVLVEQLESNEGIRL